MASPEEILKQPYARVVVPEKDGSFRAEILEFPGCIALADSPSEALISLERTAIGWLTSVIGRGQTVPPPVEQEHFSGKLILRLPKSLHRRAAAAARREGVSLNQYISNALASEVGAPGAQKYEATYSLTSPGQMMIVEMKAGHGTQSDFSALFKQWTHVKSLVATPSRELVDA